MEEAEHWKTDASKLSGLYKEVETHDALSDMTTRISNLQGTLVKKEKALEEANN